LTDYVRCHVSTNKITTRVTLKNYKYIKREKLILEKKNKKKKVKGWLPTDNHPRSSWGWLKKGVATNRQTPLTRGGDL
jgi:hypothetical protein